MSALEVPQIEYLIKLNYDVNDLYKIICNLIKSKHTKYDINILYDKQRLQLKILGDNGSKHRIIFDESEWTVNDELTDDEQDPDKTSYYSEYFDATMMNKILKFAGIASKTDIQCITGTPLLITCHMYQLSSIKFYICAKLST